MSRRPPSSGPHGALPTSAVTTILTGTEPLPGPVRREVGVGRGVRRVCLWRPPGVGTECHTPFLAPPGLTESVLKPDSRATLLLGLRLPRTRSPRGRGKLECRNPDGTNPSLSRPPRPRLQSRGRRTSRTPSGALRLWEGRRCSCLPRPSGAVAHLPETPRRRRRCRQRPLTPRKTPLETTEGREEGKEEEGKEGGKREKLCERFVTGEKPRPL